MLSTPARVVVFDVNETLSDLSPLAQTFLDIGAPRELASTWFAALLRDGFALTAAGDQASFTDIAEHGARVLLETLTLPIPLDEAVFAVLTGLGTLALHSDVAESVRRLHASGLRLFTLSNGPQATAERLFHEADVLSCFEQLLSVDRQTLWKPARDAYERVATVSGVPLHDSILVAVHPWDIHGAARAGMKTAWVNRDQTSYPPFFERPTLTVTSLADLAHNLDPRNGP